MKTIAYKIIQINGQNLEGLTDKIMVNDGENPFMILYDHAPLISALKKGKLQYYNEGQMILEIPYQTGTISVVQNQCVATIL